MIQEEQKKGELKKDEKLEKKQLSREEVIVGRLLGDIEHDPDMLDTIKCKRAQKPIIEEKKIDRTENDFYKSVEFKDVKTIWIGEKLENEGKSSQKTDIKVTKTQKPLFVSKMQQVEVCVATPSDFENYKQTFQTKTDDLKKKIVDKMVDLKILLNRKKKGFSPVSCLRNLSIFAKEEKNQKIAEKICQLEPLFPKYREIKADGNEFFRAVGLFFIEILLLENLNIEKIKYSSKNQFLEMLKDLKIIDLKSESSYPELDQLFKEDKQLILEIFQLKMNEFFLLKLALLTKDQKVENNLIVTKAIENELNNNLAFDLAMICVIRSMIYNGYCEEKDNSDYKDLMLNHEQQKTNLQTYGREPENSIVQFTAYALYIRINVFVLDVENKKKGGETFLHEEYGPNDDPNLKLVNLFFRPGQYDIGYNEKFLKESYGGIEG